MMSAPPPGPNDTMIRIGFCGQPWAQLGDAASTASIRAIASKTIVFFIPFLPNFPFIFSGGALL